MTLLGYSWVATISLNKERRKTTWSVKIYSEAHRKLLNDDYLGPKVFAMRPNYLEFWKSVNIIEQNEKSEIKPTIIHIYKKHFFETLKNYQPLWDLSKFLLWRYPYKLPEPVENQIELLKTIGEVTTWDPR